MRRKHGQGTHNTYIHIPALLLAFFLCFSLVSCKKGEKNGLAALADSFSGERYAVYDLSGRIGRKPTDDFVRRLFFRSKMPPELASLSECVFILDKGKSGFEIDILRVCHESEKKKIRDLLANRLTMLQRAEVRRYLSDEYETYIFSAGIYEYGEYLLLLSTGRNDEVLKTVKKYL